MPHSRLIPLAILCLAIPAFAAVNKIDNGIAATAPTASAEMDKDLLEVTIPQLEQLYASHKYTVTQVVQWYFARIRRYNGIYMAVQNLDEAGALATAAQEDAAAASGNTQRGPMWGVPIVTKANTSIRGLITTDGWEGYKIPGHELVAPKDATIVVRLKAAGAIILGQTNMPDFAASDTNRSTAFGRTGNAYDVRFSPGGSSGGTVTAVTSNYALLGNGTDTGNSIRMPSATSAVIGVLPTRGLISIAGIAPLDWLLDNTGPIARDVTDAAIALSVMAGEDPLDQRTVGSAAKAQPGPYTQYLKLDALKGKRFGVPAFIMQGAGIPFQGIHAAVSDKTTAAQQTSSREPLQPSTRTAFLKAIEGLRAAGATIVFDDAILPDSFAQTVSRVGTLPYVREGTENFLKTFGPSQYHSSAEYEKAVGSALPATIIGGWTGTGRRGDALISQRKIETDPNAEANYFGPRRKAVEIYNATLDRLHLDGYVYPATQMPPPDETMPQNGEISGGPHSDTGWVNMIGVPAVVVVGGFYPDGLPFGLEISARQWKDGDLLGYAYAYEQATHHRHPPLLVESGLLPIAR
ncbi:amidase [Acidicapsa ligni]|uniref:amidase n=1 Tax=Acidicapsa ligni TaxID=542300 RepID=UPI0021E0296F|nr:amidase [Acidicapsa ligni]